MDYWGGGGDGAQRICWPPSKITGGPCPPPPHPVPTPMLILSFKEESDISSLNGHVEMTTNTVIRLDAQVDPHLCIWRESARALTHV